jgi:hypothetical protein
LNPSSPALRLDAFSTVSPFANGMSSQSYNSAFRGVHARPTRKRQRASRACDFCHGRGLKCRQDESSTRQHAASGTCLTCLDYGVKCTLDRPIRRRGRKPLNRNHHPEECDDDGRYMLPSPQEQVYDDNAESFDDPSYFRSVSCIRRLVRIYCDTMYQC